MDLNAKIKFWYTELKKTHANAIKLAGAIKLNRMIAVETIILQDDALHDRGIANDTTALHVLNILLDEAEADEATKKFHASAEKHNMPSIQKQPDGMPLWQKLLIGGAVVGVTCGVGYGLYAIFCDD